MMSRSTHVLPPSVETRRGPLGLPIGVGMNVVAARIWMFAGSTARNGSPLIPDSSLSACGIMSTTWIWAVRRGAAARAAKRATAELAKSLRTVISFSLSISGAQGLWGSGASALPLEEATDAVELLAAQHVERIDDDEPGRGKARDLARRLEEEDAALPLFEARRLLPEDVDAGGIVGEDGPLPQGGRPRRPRRGIAGQSPLLDRVDADRRLPPERVVLAAVRAAGLLGRPRRAADADDHQLGARQAARQGLVGERGARRAHLGLDPLRLGGRQPADLVEAEAGPRRVALGEEDSGLAGLEPRGVAEADGDLLAGHVAHRVGFVDDPIDDHDRRPRLRRHGRRRPADRADGAAEDEAGAAHRVEERAGEVGARREGGREQRENEESEEALERSGSHDCLLVRVDSPLLTGGSGSGLVTGGLAYHGCAREKWSSRTDPQSRRRRCGMGFLERFTGPIYALFRIVFGLLFASHGAQKVFGLFGGPKAGPPLIVVAGWIELVTGLLITVGLFAGIAAFIASGEMAVAYFMARAANGAWPLVNHGEAAVLYCFAFLLMAARGSGIWSIDSVRGAGVAATTRG